MWIFSKPPEQLTEDDLRGLITNGVRESVTLEYKRQMYERRDPDARKEMLRDISSIANAEGGVLIIGMEEEGGGTAQALGPVPDAEAEAGRIVSSCLAGIAERIPGLKATRVPITGGDAIVVVIPRSYRKPHMVTADGLNEFWIRHDRQKSRMSIAEVRAAVTAAEELEMKAATFIAQRRAAVSHTVPGLLFSLMATPLLLEGGRIAISDQRFHELLANPPTFRPGGRGVALSSQNARIAPTITGLRATERNLSRLDLFRSGHIEFVLVEPDYIRVASPGADRVLLRPWAVAEFLRNLTHFVERLRQLAAISDPYLFTVSLWRCRGIGMSELRERPVWGLPEPSLFEEEDDLLIEPIISATDEGPDVTSRRLADRFWNAFQFMACPFFGDDGRFFIPDR